ncbi:TPA: glycoside hydrolase family protein [Klebsiella aerogenes]|uniref:glycoside hydrolase family protein n=1 Tax=Klebsiella TaxID=570 RepID=UPI0029291448|nr:muraminidase [Klebsiella sp. 141203]MDU9366296.1 muraminidase [Klebsiella sp. 141203]HEP0587639.1 muraminidase [Klebsiella aerogenes]
MTVTTLSLPGLRFIQRTQGLALLPYQDKFGQWRVGYGHAIGEDEKETPITAELAMMLLTLDLLRCQQILQRRLVVELTQPQYDALLALVFSLDGGAQPQLDAILHYLNGHNMTQALAIWRHIDRDNAYRLQECERFCQTS